MYSIVARTSHESSFRVWLTIDFLVDKEKKKLYFDGQREVDLTGYCDIVVRNLETGKIVYEQEEKL